MCKNAFKPTTLLLGLLLLGLSVSPALAEDALVRKIQERYQGVSGMSGEFSQVLLHKESGSRTEQTGTIAFGKPLRVRWEVLTPKREELIVINAAEVWDYIPGEEIVYKYPPEIVQDSRTMIKVLTGQANLGEDFKIKAGPRENGLNQLRLIPKEPTQQLTSAVIWVDDDGAIRRAKVQDFFGNENDITFTSLVFDPPLADGLFKFSPPRGLEVEDHSGAGTPSPTERRLFQ